MTGPSTPRPWSTHEDSLLRQAVAEHGDEQAAWKIIADCVPGRSNKACRKRWLHSLSPTIRKTPWTPAEDALLLKLYATHTPPRWSLIAKSIPGRTDDACSKRYREALDPLLKKDGWTPEEDTKLTHLTAQIGSKWTQVGQAMGRSGLGCRNRWRLLERKQRSRTIARPAIPQEATNDVMAYSHGDYYLPDHSVSIVPPPSIPYHAGSTEQVHTSLDASFSSTVLVTASQSSSLVHCPPPCSISTDSSLSGALASAPSSIRDNPDSFASISINPNFISTSQSPPADDVFELPHPLSSFPQLHGQTSPTDPDTPIAETPEACPTVVPSSPPEHPGADPGPGVSVQGEERSSIPPRKRPRLGGPLATEQGEHTRLSSHLPADLDRTVLAYACGHSICWPGPTGYGASCFATASELAEHRRIAHSGDESLNDGRKAYRCALQGCGKGWKNINGIQYHLQISKAHFKAALSQTQAPSGSAASPSKVMEANVYASDSAKEKRPGINTRKRKEHRCPHEGCMNSYKQRSGLQYHLSHGHPANVAQLNAIPPVLMRKLSGGAPEH